MTTASTCLACGHEGRDVSMRLVEIREGDQRVVSVSVVMSEDRQGVKVFDQRDVRERYATEPRCRDARACAKRVTALAKPVKREPQPEPAADIEDPLAWL